MAHPELSNGGAWNDHLRGGVHCVVFARSRVPSRCRSGFAGVGGPEEIIQLYKADVASRTTQAKVACNSGLGLVVLASIPDKHKSLAHVASVTHACTHAYPCSAEADMHLFRMIDAFTCMCMPCDAVEPVHSATGLLSPPLHRNLRNAGAHCMNEVHA